MKKVNIIVPVYNVEPYLRTCLDAIAAQSYPSFEAILINDGSTDGSGDLCQAYADRDSRFKVIHQANAGAANAKNAGLDCVSGDYVTFVDSDDYVAVNWLERMVAALEDSGADVVECSFEKVFADHSEPGNRSQNGRELFNGEDYMAQYLNGWTCSLFWNKLFKAELTKDIRFRRERRCIDDEFYTYKVVSRAAKVVRIPEQLYFYRQRRSGAVTSEKNRYQITMDALEVLVERYQWVSRRFPDLWRIYLHHDVDMLLGFASRLLFNEECIRVFRQTAAWYLRECLRRYPGKVTLYYAVKAYLYPKKKFPAVAATHEHIAVEQYFP